MTEQETNRILGMIVEMYPAFRRDRDAGLTSRLWHSLFQEVPYEQMQQALMEFIATDTKGFPPAPGMLRAILLSHMDSEELPEMEAWRLTLRAISRGTYYSRQEFNKLPPVIRRVVGSPENLHDWAGMDERQVSGNIQPWFLRAYQQRLEKERSGRLLPAGSVFRLPEAGES